MDIRNWPLDRIMQLPDHCFGRRWPLIFSTHNSLPLTVYLISEMSLPERCVFWEIYWAATSKNPSATQVQAIFALALADQLPANDAEFIAAESLFSGIDERLNEIRVGRWSLHLTNLRQSCQSAGRRVVVRVRNIVGADADFSLGLIVSSVPTEVPDCLLSV